MLLPPNSTVSAYGDLRQPLTFLRMVSVGPAEGFFNHVEALLAPSVCPPPPVIFQLAVSVQCKI